MFSLRISHSQEYLAVSGPRIRPSRPLKMIKGILDVGQMASLSPSKATKVSWEIPSRYKNLFKAAPGAIQGLQSMLMWLLEL